MDGILFDNILHLNLDLLFSRIPINIIKKGQNNKILEIFIHIFKNNSDGL
jgi:hypothetical protein